MTNSFNRQCRTFALRGAIVIVLLLLVTGGAQAQDPNLAFCTNGVPPCNPNEPPKPGEPGCFKPPPAWASCEPCNNCNRSPCSVSSGAYTTKATDLTIQTTGFPLTADRLYQSTHLIDGDLGYGWVSGLSARLYYAERQSTAQGGTVREADVRLTSGALYRFTENADGSFTPPRGRLDKLVRNADGTWDFWLQRTRSRLHFSTTGNLVEMIDDFGNKQIWTYVNDRLDRITDASGSGRYIQIDWGADGRISDITDPIGRNIHYTYQGGVLTEVRNPLGQSTRYRYLPGKYTPRLVGIDDHWFRNITEIRYVAADQDRVLSYTEKGETYTYTYGYNGVATTTAKTDSSGHTWVFPFGTDGLVGEDRPPGGGPGDKIEYDANGLVQLYTDAANGKTRYTYNSLGYVLSQTIAEGTPHAVEWRFVYDANFPSLVTSVTAYQPGTNTVHPDWQARKYDYYPPGSTAPGALHHVYEVDDDGVTSRVMRTYTYDSHGRMLTETFANGGVRSRFYDAKGNLEREESPANNVAGVRPSTTFTYDDVGRVETQTDALGNVTTLSWDGLDRLRSRTDPLPSPGSPFTFTTSVFYDEFDAATQLLSQRMVDPNGATTVVARDAYEQVWRETDAAGHSVTFEWEKGLLKSKTDANDNPTSYSHDARRRLEKITYPDSTFEQYTYRADGLIQTFRDRAGMVVSYQYDSFKRMTSTTYPTGAVTSWTFNGQKLMSVQDTRPSSAGTLTHTWSPSFRIASETQGSRGTLEWTYDADGRKKTETVAGGATTTYEYHPDGSVRTIQWSPSLGDFVHAYDLAGRLKETQFPNGQTRTWSYDGLGRVASVANVHPTAGNLATFSSGYDVNAFTGQSNRLGLLTSTTTSFPALAMAGAVTKLDYDARNMLIRADYPAGTAYNGLTSAWTFDAAGNRTSATNNGVTSTYTYRKYGTNPLNGDVLLSDGASSYGYDNAGNTATRSGARGNFTFGWDADNRLTSVSGDQAETYAYDVIHRRVTTTGTAGTTHHLYSDFEMVAESGASTAQYLFGAGLDRPLAMLRDGQVYYYVIDTLGSVVAVTNSAGAVVNSYAYDAWGTPVAHNETVANPFGYTARPLAAAGLADHRFRSYEAATGSFRSFDPLIAWGGRAMATGMTSRVGALPGYSYADGRPTMAIDPMGLQTLSCPEGCRARRDVAITSAYLWWVAQEAGCVAGARLCFKYSKNPAICLPAYGLCWALAVTNFLLKIREAEELYDICLMTCPPCKETSPPSGSPSGPPSGPPAPPPQYNPNAPGPPPQP